MQRPGRSCGAFGGLLAAAVLAGCGSDPTPSSGEAGSTAAGTGASSSGNGGSGGGDAGGGAGGGAGAGATGGGAGSGGDAGSGGGGAGGCSVSKTDAEQPLLLSETGCVDMADPSQPAPGLVPYSVLSALWSDGATKERFVRVPDGAKIHAVDCAVDVDACADPGTGGDGLDDGHWDMPIGTVLVKSFSIEGKRIETRLLMRRTSLIWKGFSYEWNEAGTEADLLSDDAEGKDKEVGAGQIWHYPSRSQCLECHTRYAGRSLGPSTRQLSSDYEYADGVMNQIEKFQQLGLFDAPPKALAGYPDPFGAGTLEERARSYLQTNCAICHRPGGEFSTVDMRFGTAFADTNLCGQSERDTGLVPDYRVVPGEPESSALSFRVHALDPGVRMPIVGSNVVDPMGSALIDAWITALPPDACPPQPPL